MRVLLVWPGAVVQARRIPVEGYEVGDERILELEVLATESAAECRFAVRDVSQGGWLQLSTDGGTTWASVPAAGSGIIAGPDCGALAADQRLPIMLKIVVPTGTSIRTRSIEPVLGLGIDDTIATNPPGTGGGWDDPEPLFDGGDFTDPDAGTPAPVDGGTF